jgi:ArsR family transcriptional regulator
MAGVELNVGQIVAATHRNVANVSKHLKQLAEGGLLMRRKEGPFVLYRMNDPVVEKICTLVCDSLRREIESQLKRGRKLLDQQSRK